MNVITSKHQRVLQTPLGFWCENIRKRQRVLQTPLGFWCETFRCLQDPKVFKNKILY